jgi:hypothetical protein
MSTCVWFSFDPRLSWDGLLTFLGGLLAFFAILYQVRHADSGLRTQLNTERETRTREIGEQRRTVAVALLSEIKFFEKYYLNVAEGALANAEADKSAPQSINLTSPPANSFPLYHANAYRIGEYGRSVVDSLQSFYGPAERFVLLLSDWVRARTGLYVATSLVQSMNVAEIVLRDVRSALPDLRHGLNKAISALETYLEGAADR